jgi:ribosomal protein S17E
MGRIKSKLVKRTGHNLLKEENKFNDNFEDNKKLVKGLGTSKKIRNKIAGYITRINRRNVKSD